MAVSDNKGDPGAAERGRRASIGQNGEVHGSGAGTGGGGTPEDFDSDPVGGGGGDLEPRRRVPMREGGDAPVHNSR